MSENYNHFSKKTILPHKYSKIFYDFWWSKTALWNSFLERLKIEKDVMVLITGDTGCLAKDTIVAGQTKTLDELYTSGQRMIDTVSYKKFNEKCSGCNYPIKSKSEIIDSGIKECYEIELEDGRKVIATADHRLFKTHKRTFVECEVKDLKIGDSLKEYDYKKLWKKQSKEAQKRRDLKHSYSRLCRKCKKLFFVEKKRALGVVVCKSCLRKEKTYKDDVWFEWEDNILRQFYYDSDKAVLTGLLINRSWSAIQHRAERLKIERSRKRQWEKTAFTSTKNPMKNPKFKQKAKNSLIKLYREHPEKLLNARLRRDQMTNIEKVVASILNKNNIKYEWNKYIKTKKTWRFPDFKVGNLIIECDGEYWHNKTKDSDKKRQIELEELGYKVIRFTDKEILNKPEEVEKCIKQELNL